MDAAFRDRARETGPALEAHYRFILWLVPAVERFPRSQKFLLGDRIQRNALDILEALIEATYTRQRGPHLSRANLGIEKLRFLLRLAHDLRYLDLRRYEHAARCLDETGRKIGAWSKSHHAKESTASVWGRIRATARYEAFRDRFRYVLRGDIYRYFPAIDHEILKRDLRRRIACPRTLALADRIIDASNPQEPVLLHYPGDDLFTPLARRRGLPIGNLTSQFFANLYLGGLDHFCKEVLRAKGYVRYVDDFALFHDDAEQLEAWRRRIATFLESRRLRLHPRKTHCVATREPASFLGFILFPDGYRRLPEENVRRFRNRLRGLRTRWRTGGARREDIQHRVGAWIAHAEHANTWRLRRAIFRGGWFDPSWKPDRPPANAWRAAVPGTTNRETSVPPTATGTPPETATTIWVSELPARSIARVGSLTGPPGARTSVQGRS